MFARASLGSRCEPTLGADAFATSTGQGSRNVGSSTREVEDPRTRVAPRLLLPPSLAGAKSGGLGDVEVANCLTSFPRRPSSLCSSSICDHSHCVAIPLLSLSFFIFLIFFFSGLPVVSNERHSSDVFLVS